MNALKLKFIYQLISYNINHLANLSDSNRLIDSEIDIQENCNSIDYIYVGLFRKD